MCDMSGRTQLYFSLIYLIPPFPTQSLMLVLPHSKFPSTYKSVLVFIILFHWSLCLFPRLIPNYLNYNSLSLVFDMSLCYSLEVSCLVHKNFKINFSNSMKHCHGIFYWNYIYSVFQMILSSISIYFNFLWCLSEVL